MASARRALANKEVIFMTYNGWKNRQTWNVALWLQNDENLYNDALDFMRSEKERLSPRDVHKPYIRFCDYIGLTGLRTPDNISWISTRLDYAALNSMMRDL